ADTGAGITRVPATAAANAATPALVVAPRQHPHDRGVCRPWHGGNAASVSRAAATRPTLRRRTGLGGRHVRRTVRYRRGLPPPCKRHAVRALCRRDRRSAGRASSRRAAAVAATAGHRVFLQWPDAGVRRL